MSIDQDIHLSPYCLGEMLPNRDFGELNVIISRIHFNALNIGWTVVETFFATGYLDILAMVGRAGFYDHLLELDDNAFLVFNPDLGDPDPTGSFYYTDTKIFNVIGVPVGDGPTFHDSNIEALRAAIDHNTTFRAETVPAVGVFDGRIKLISKLPGELGNNHVLIPHTHTIQGTSPVLGGYHFRSVPFWNSNNYWEVKVYESDRSNELVVLPRINLSWRGGSGIIGGNLGEFTFYRSDRLVYIMDPHQFLIFAPENASPPTLDDPAGFIGGGHHFWISTPWFPPEHPLTYGGFSLPLIRDRLRWNTGIQTSTNAITFYGDFEPVGETGLAMNSLFGYEHTDLPLANGQPMILSPLVGMGTLANAERRIVGATWNSFVISRRDPLDSVIKVDDQSYFALSRNLPDCQNTTLYYRLPDGWVGGFQ